MNIGSDAYVVALAADAQLAVLTTQGGELRVLDFRGGDVVSALTLAASKMLAVMISLDRQILSIAASSSDRNSGWSNIALWFFDANTGELVRKQDTPIAYDGGGSYVFTSDLRRLYCCHSRGDIGVLDAVTGAYSTCCEEQASPRRNARDGRNFAATSPDQSLIACGWHDGLEIWDLRSGAMTHSFEMDGLEACGFSKDGRKLYGASPKLLTLWDTDSGEVLRKIPGSFDRICSFGTSNNGDVLLCSMDSAVSGSQITSYFVETGTAEANYLVGASRVELCFMNSDCRTALFGSLQEGLQLWDPGGNRPRFTLHVLPDANFAVLGHDGCSVLYASADAWRYFDAISECDGGPPHVDLVETVTGPWPDLNGTLVEMT